MVATCVLADETPQDAYNLFWACIKDGKFSQAAAFLFPAGDKQFLEKQKAYYVSNSEKLRSGELTIAVMDGKVQGDWAFLIVKISISNNGKIDESIQYEIMARHGSKWKYVFKQMAGDPSLKAHSAEDFAALEKWWKANRDAYRKGK